MSAVVEVAVTGVGPKRFKCHFLPFTSLPNMEAAADGPSWMKRQDSAVGRKEAAVAKYIQQREDFKEDPYAVHILSTH